MATKSHSGDTAAQAVNRGSCTCWNQAESSGRNSSSQAVKLFLIQPKKQSNVKSNTLINSTNRHVAVHSLFFIITISILVSGIWSKPDIYLENHRKNSFLTNAFKNVTGNRYSFEEKSLSKMCISSNKNKSCLEFSVPCLYSVIIKSTLSLNP